MTNYKTDEELNDAILKDIEDLEAFVKVLEKANREAEKVRVFDDLIAQGAASKDIN